MRIRHAFALAALAFLLSACGSAITAPEIPTPDQPTMNGGWAGGGGRTADT